MTTAQPHTTGFQPRTTLSSLMHASGIMVKRMTRRHEFRKAFEPLLNERDQILMDIGYQRYDILRALRLPLSEDAMSYVESKRLTRPTEESHG